MLLALMFFFIFGWKVTPAIDVVAIVSLLLCVLVVLESTWRLTKLELQIVLVLGVLSTYSILIVIIHGAADSQIALRGLRALLNFAGGMALVRLYFIVNRDRASDLVVRHLFLCFVVHAGIIVAMFVNADLRLAVYNQLDTLAYINNTASVELGLRNSGLTYGLSQTSVLQVTGLLLIPALLTSIGERFRARLCVWVGAAAIIVSLFLTGRSGLVVGAFVVPVAFLLSARIGDRKGGRVLTTALFLLLCVGAVIIVYRMRPEVFPEQIIGALVRAEEAATFFLMFGDTPTTQFVSQMYFLPDTWQEFLFGTSNLGRGSLAYVESDVGYVRLIFAIGVIGMTLTVAPYLMAVAAGVRSIALRWHDRVATAIVLSLIATLVLNFKELAILTRNQWSVQAILISLLAVQNLQSVRRVSGATSGPRNPALGAIGAK